MAESPTEGWARAGSVRIHYLDRAGSAGPSPVLVVPGFGEAAPEYLWLLSALAPRRAVAMSARGRGRSDAPAAGYSWEDHIADIEAVVSAAGLERLVLVAFSRGSSYALGYALSHPETVDGLVVGDYWARHVGLPATFVEHQLTVSIRGVPVSERMPAHAVAGVQQESVEVPLWDRLGELRCPVLLVRGTRRSALADEAVVARWQEALPSVEVATVDAGHDLWGRDPDGYLAEVLPFLSSIGSHA